MKDTYGKTSTGMTKFTKGMTKRFNNAGANLSRVGSNLISSNKKKNDVSLYFYRGYTFDMGYFIKRGAPSRWSASLYSPWWNPDKMIIRKTHPNILKHC